MKEKGATRLDKGAHNLMAFYDEEIGKDLHGFVRTDRYTAFYHEERLYSVFDNVREICSLVYADSPYKSIEKVSEGNITFISNGNSNTQIGHVGVLNI